MENATFGDLSALTDAELVEIAGDPRRPDDLRSDAGAELMQRHRQRQEAAALGRPATVRPSGREREGG